MACIERGLAAVQTVQAEIRLQVEDIQRVALTLKPETGSLAQRRAALLELGECFRRDPTPVRQHFGKLIASFAPGLLVGEDDPSLPTDNLELERAFRLPKSHERRIHGHCHAGVRIVQEGPTLLPVLDAHTRSDTPFTGETLLPYAHAKPPPCQVAAVHRRHIMRKARSPKNLSRLLRDLESRYLNSS